MQGFVYIYIYISKDLYKGMVYLEGHLSKDYFSMFSF